MEPTQEPLPSKMRPESLDDFVGQKYLVGPGKPLRVAIEGRSLAGKIEGKEVYVVVTALISGEK